MKKVITILITLARILSFSASALADFDLSGLSFEELVALKDQINLAIWESEEWQEVTVPQGVWEVGADIPAGKWTISAADGAISSVTIGKELRDNGQDVKPTASGVLVSPSNVVYKQDSSRLTWDIDLVDGDYIKISTGSVVFTPYAGKPSLGFK